MNIKEVLDKLQGISKRFREFQKGFRGCILADMEDFKLSETLPDDFKAFRGASKHFSGF